MKTVKEVSKLTGVSVRTLHYYDEIGLLPPTEVTGAGYRLYDDAALELLGQILLFRELDFPLAEIRRILENPDLDRSSVLARQREMLRFKMQRLERVIAGIDDMLKGEQTMDFTVFDETELRAMFEDMLETLAAPQRQIFVDRYGSVEAWEQHMMESASDEKAQKNYAKVVEWFGGADAFRASRKNPPKSEVFAAYQNRIAAIQKKLADKKGADVTSFEVKQIVGEYDFVAKQLYQIDDAQPLLTSVAKGYLENGDVIRDVDSVYGAGTAEYIGRAILAFYGWKS